MRNWKRVLKFIETAENIGVINILFILNPKYSTYGAENQLYPSRNQDMDLEKDTELQVLVVVAGELCIGYFPETGQPLHRH